MAIVPVRNCSADEGQEKNRYLGCETDGAEQEGDDALRVADLGSELPKVISGSAVVAVVLSLQTSGPML